jgi:hypothetical protein
MTPRSIPSWPGLSRPSTFCPGKHIEKIVPFGIVRQNISNLSNLKQVPNVMFANGQDMDIFAFHPATMKDANGRDKPGHDGRKAL